MRFGAWLRFAVTFWCQAPKRNQASKISQIIGYITYKKPVTIFIKYRKSEYLGVLERLMTLDNLPAWSTHIRSADTLRKSPKRHFADPSLAVGALGLSIDKLLSDLNYFGLLFESLAIRDLRIYAEANGGQVYHYRDSRNLEIDAIIEYDDGTWGAFEIKLGFGAADHAASLLQKFADKIDTEKA